ncbi:hypothetical protein ACLB2K_024516 [Fragaria x ananassa]
MVWSFDWWGVGGTADYCHGMSGILESGREFMNWCALKIRENATSYFLRCCLSRKPRILWIPPKLFSSIAMGKKLVFVTNNSTKSRKQYANKFLSLGISVSEEEIFSSSFAAAMYLQLINFPQHKKVYVIGEQGILEELQLAGFTALGGPPLFYLRLVSTPASLDPSWVPPQKRFSIAAARDGKELCLAAKVEDTRMLIMPDNVDFFPSA